MAKPRQEPKPHFADLGDRFQANDDPSNATPVVLTAVETVEGENLPPDDFDYDELSDSWSPDDVSALQATHHRVVSLMTRTRQETARELELVYRNFGNARGLTSSS